MNELTTKDFIKGSKQCHWKAQTLKDNYLRAKWEGYDIDWLRVNIEIRKNYKSVKSADTFLIGIIDYVDEKVYDMYMKGL